MKARNIVNGNVVWFGSQGIEKLYLSKRPSTERHYARDISIRKTKTTIVDLKFYVPHFNRSDYYYLSIQFTQKNPNRYLMKTFQIDNVNPELNMTKIADGVYQSFLEMKLLFNLDYIYIENSVSRAPFEYELTVYSEPEKADSFVYQQEGVAADLTQRLSVLKNELWYQINYGLPLLDKIKSKAVVDASVLDVITSHPNVVRVSKFESQVLNRKYSCKATIESEFGPVQLNL